MCWRVSRLMTPPAPSVSSSGWGATTMTRAARGSVSVGRPVAVVALWRSANSTRLNRPSMVPPPRTPPVDSDPIPLEQIARNHQTLDLVRALADDHERRVPIVALDAELL